MKQVPKYVLKLLERRTKLAMDLIDVCCRVDDYCEKVGVDMTADESCVITHVMIYAEPWNARDLTLAAIEKALKGGADHEAV